MKDMGQRSCGPPASRTTGTQYRLVVFGVFAIAYFFSFFHRVSLAVVASDLRRDLGVGPAQIGLMSSAYFLAYAMAQPLAGAFSDRIGPRATTSLLMSLGAAGSALFALATSLPLALFARVLAGMGMAGGLVPGMKALSTYFADNEFARVNGLLISIGNLGAVFAATPLAYLASAFGWRTSFGLVAVLSLMLACLCWMVVVDHPGSSSRPHPPLREAGTGPCTAGGSAIRQVVSSRIFWLLGTFLLCKYSAQATFQALWGVPYLVEVYKVSRAGAATVVMMITVGYVIGAPSLGYISDRLAGRRKSVLMAAAITFAVTWVPIVLWPGKVPVAVLGVLLFVMGVGASSANLALVMVKESFPAGVSGTAIGCINVMNMGGAAFVPTLAGWLIGRFNSVQHDPNVVYSHALLPCVVLALTGCVAVAFVRGSAVAGVSRTGVEAGRAQSCRETVGQ